METIKEEVEEVVADASGQQEEVGLCLSLSVFVELTALSGCSPGSLRRSHNYPKSFYIILAKN